MTNTNLHIKQSSWPAVSYSIKDAAAVSGLSRSFLYQLISAGRLASVKVGSRRLILASGLEALVKGAA